jgi:hypothetical protein
MSGEYLKEDTWEWIQPHWHWMDQKACVTLKKQNCEWVQMDNKQQKSYKKRTEVVTEHAHADRTKVPTPLNAEALGSEGNTERTETGISGTSSRPFIKILDK